MIVIVHGPPACGKTRNSAKLQRLAGCKHVLDMDDFEKMSPNHRRRFADGNLLLLTTDQPGLFVGRYPKAIVLDFSSLLANLDQMAG